MQPFILPISRSLQYHSGTAGCPTAMKLSRRGNLPSRFVSSSLCNVHQPLPRPHPRQSGQSLCGLLTRQAHQDCSLHVPHRSILHRRPSRTPPRRSTVASSALAGDAETDVEPCSDDLPQEERPRRRHRDGRRAALQAGRTRLPRPLPPRHRYRHEARRRRRDPTPTTSAPPRATRRDARNARSTDGFGLTQNPPPSSSRSPSSAASPTGRSRRTSSAVGTAGMHAWCEAEGPSSFEKTEEATGKRRAVEALGDVTNVGRRKIVDSGGRKPQQKNQRRTRCSRVLDRAGVGRDDARGC
ncbi:hypothetical protein C8R46DRAFT_425676 [Mycena filopes]|nr:hypothetical protein C8R46DRAFT_425676 [Mycena filopes]